MNKSYNHRGESISNFLPPSLYNNIYGNPADPERYSDERRREIHFNRSKSKRITRGKRSSLSTLPSTA